MESLVNNGVLYFTGAETCELTELHITSDDKATAVSGNKHRALIRNKKLNKIFYKDYTNNDACLFRELDKNGSELIQNANKNVALLRFAII